MALGGIVGVRHRVGARAVRRLPLMCPGRALRQFPFEAEQILEEVVAPLRRRRRPGDLESARDRVGALSAPVAIGPSQALLGDARGLGLYLGIELVRDRETLEPADIEASYIIERMRDLGVLVSIDGPHNNVLKIKPPIVWGEAEADRLITTLDRVLADPALAR